MEQKFEPGSKILINGKMRTLYKIKNLKTKYIKYKGKYIKFTQYKKIFKIKGGRGPYTEEDLIISHHGIIYSEKHRKYPLDILINDYVKKGHGIILNGNMYNVESLYDKIFHQKSLSDPENPTITISSENQRRIKNKYNEIYNNNEDDLPLPPQLKRSDSYLANKFSNLQIKSSTRK
jgi:hypothetical protein